MDAKTIGQFTGLVDNTGKEIYEDDIISLDNGRIGVITFHDGCFVVNYSSGTRQALYDVQDWKMTILGNRFENPELLVAITASKKNENPAQELELPSLDSDFVVRE